MTSEWVGCGPSCCRCHCDCEDAVAERIAYQKRIDEITDEEWAEINERVRIRAEELGWGR